MRRGGRQVPYTDSRYLNSLEHSDARLYLGAWSASSGKLWWDDLSVEEIGLVNVLRRPGCPVDPRRWAERRRLPFAGSGLLPADLRGQVQ